MSEVVWGLLASMSTSIDATVSLLAHSHLVHEMLLAPQLHGEAAMQSHPRGQQCCGAAVVSGDSSTGDLEGGCMVASPIAGPINTLCTASSNLGW